MVYITVFSLKFSHANLNIRHPSKCILIAAEIMVSNIRHITLIICQTGRAFQYFFTKDGLSLRCSLSSLLVVLL